MGKSRATLPPHGTNLIPSKSPDATILQVITPVAGSLADMLVGEAINALNEKPDDLFTVNELLHRAVSIDSNHIEAHYQYAKLFYASGMSARAIIHIEKCLAASRRRRAVSYHFLAGLIYLRDGSRPQQAVEELSKAFSVEPDCMTLLLLMECWLQQQNYQSIYAHSYHLAEMLIDDGDDETAAWMYHARSLVAEDRVNEAIELLKNVIKRSPDRETMIFYALLINRMKRRDEAFEIISKAMRIINDGWFVGNEFEIKLYQEAGEICEAHCDVVLATILYLRGINRTNQAILESRIEKCESQIVTARQIAELEKARTREFGGVDSACDAMRSGVRGNNYG